jgi:hypothetical protein
VAASSDRGAIHHRSERMVRLLSVVLLVSFSIASHVSCARANAQPNCDKMRACCSALKAVENGLPSEHEILCHHNPELDEGCSETISDIAKFTPAKSLPAQCK